MKDELTLIVSILGAVSIIGGFLYWHFKTIHNFREQVTDLKLDMKELEKRDALQQQTLDQLKEFYPIIKIAFETLNKNKI